MNGQLILILSSGRPPLKADLVVSALWVQPHTSHTMTEHSGHNLDPTGSAAVQEALSKKEKLLSQDDLVLPERVPHRVNIRGAYRRKIRH